MAPEIDGVVYLNEDEVQDAPRPGPGEFVNVEITDAGTYDLVGRILK
jgi:ribosomal protein S12 methylthiotransferase